MKKQKQENKLQKVTVVFGYGLFALFLASLTINTIVPWISTLFTPNAKHLNIVVFTISLLAGAVLPTLLAYFLGDRATRAKSKLVHHFNGILFGIAAYWIALFVGYIGSDTINKLRDILPEPWSLAINSGWQIVITVAIIAIVSATYARRQKKISVLEHRPYQIVLFSGIVLSAMYGAANMPDPNMLIATFLTLGLPIILLSLAYIALLKINLSSTARLTLSAVCMSLVFISAQIASASLAYMVPYDDLLFSTLVVGVAVMAAYLLLLRPSK